MQPVRQKPIIMSIADRLLGPAAREVHRIVAYAAVGTVLLGCTTRIWRFVLNQPLWFDELALALNIVELPWTSLVTVPLGFRQVAPAGFLLLESACVAIFGSAEFALRAVPIVAGVVCVFLFARLAWRTLSARTAIFAMLTFALAPNLVRYSAEVKQYSSDVMLALLLTLLALRYAEWPARSQAAVVAAVAGAIAVWFSYAVVLVVAGLGLAVIVLSWSASRARRSLVIPLGVVAVWSVSAVGVTTISREWLLSPETSVYMQRFWSSANAEGFVPLPPGNLYEALWLLRPSRGMGFIAPFHDGTGEVSVPWFGLLCLSSLGLASLIRRAPSAAVLLAAPAGPALFASALRLYPFGGRMSLFLLPAFIIFLAEGIDAVARRVSSPTIARAVVGAAAVIPLWAFISTPLGHSERLPSVLRRFQLQLRPDDAVYVYYGASLGMRFYANRLGLDSHYDEGRCHRGQPREYLRELDRYRGQPRVWVLVSHALLEEEPEILGYLDAIGERRLNLTDGSASAYLFDLSQPARLAQSNAASHPLRSQVTVGSWGCSIFLAGPASPNSTRR